MNEQIYEEASEWFARMRDGEDRPPQSRELMAWLRRSPEHVSAYLDIAAVWVEARNSAVDADLNLQTRVALAREEALAEQNVIAFTSRARAADRPQTKVDRKLWRAVAAAAACVILAVSTAWLYAQRGTYSTEVGEQQSITLSDGSTVELNSRSRLRVRFSEAERVVELLEGQVLIQAERDPARPFVVRSADTRVRAVGTQFDVYRKPSSMVVTVIKGRVAVGGHSGMATRGSPTAQPGEIYVGAGEQLTMSPDSASRPVRVNVAAATAWTRRELIFDFTPLAEVAAEFNRYNRRPLIVQGERLRALKISAIFRSTDGASLVRYLRAQPGIQIRETESAIWIAAATP